MPDIHFQFQINSSADAVFEAISTPNGLNAWWTLNAEAEPFVGGIYRLYFGPDFDWLARVTHLEIDRQLSWSLERAMEDWMPTRFGFALAEHESLTTVRFYHTDWERVSDHFAISSYCWGQLLKGLKDYVECGIVVPFDRRS